MKKLRSVTSTFPHHFTFLFPVRLLLMKSDGRTQTFAKRSLQIKLQTPINFVIVINEGNLIPAQLLLPFLIPFVRLDSRLKSKKPEFASNQIRYIICVGLMF